MNMSVNIAGVEWKNPVTVASGTFGSGAEFEEFVDLNKLGAVTTKGVANVPWAGNATPRVAETYGGMMNAIGLQNPRIDLFCERDIPFLKKYDTKIIVNVCGHAPEEYFEVVERLADEPIDMMEINISCPNVNAGFLAFGQDPKQVEALTADIIYACGPTPMLRAIKNYAESNGIECYISLEERMACGIGVCLACVCKTKEKDHHSNVNNKRICKDGPVFLSTEVEI